jgi:hypothetical protein
MQSSSSQLTLPGAELTGTGFLLTVSTGHVDAAQAHLSIPPVLLPCWPYDFVCPRLGIVPCQSPGYELPPVKDS